MRSIPRPRLTACALVCAALVVAGSVAPAFGLPEVTPAKAARTAAQALRTAAQALRIAKRAESTSKQALAHTKKPGPMGPQGPRGSEGLDGPQGADGDRGPRGTTGPAGPAGDAGASGLPGASGATGPQGPPGSARAFGTVDPAGPALVGARTNGVTDVSRTSDDHYCLTIAGGASTTSPSVSIDLAFSSDAPGALWAALDSTGGACTPAQLSVVTVGPTPNAVGFTILIP
jgi:collagen triple helix repeat protein